MKSILKLSFSIALLFSINLTSFAQSQDYKSNVFVGTGFSLVGGGLNAAAVLLNAQGNIKTTPAFQATFDYSVNQWLSLGAGISYQQASGSVSNYTFTLDSMNFTTEDFDVNYSRLVIGGRVLFHYDVGENVDLYSGVRVNYKSVNLSTTSTDPNFDRDLFALPGFGVQIIGIGVRYYVTDNLGLSAETGIGAPHFLNVGLNYRM